ncbi:putative RNA-directed DNA polymerase [Helianthus debilis subsp. tardiflorus]
MVSHPWIRGSTNPHSPSSDIFFARRGWCTFTMDDMFLNPFSDMYAFTGSSGNNDTSSSNTNENQPKEKKKEAWESESAFGTFNKPPKLMAIEDYSRWIMDSGASRHMTGKTALLYDVNNINGGYVGFAGNQGGRIIGEGTLSNGVITFERVNYIAELENNLLSISQICDRMYTTHFTNKECLILKPGFVIPEEWIIMRAPRVNDLYVLDMSVATTTTGQAHCFVSRATEKESRLWHRKMGHIHLRKMNQLVHTNLVTGVNIKGFHLEGECISCVKGKQKKKSHPTKQTNSVSRPLERLHMDLFGPVNVKNITGDSYCLVVTDDYSRFSWVMFLKSKDETFDSLMVLFKKIENLYQRPICRIRSDNGTEFKNSKMEEYCDERGILHEFSAPYTPQQNGVAERKNRTLIETARTMLADSKLPINFWGEAVSAACYTLNRVLTVKKFNKTCLSYSINASRI